MTPRPLSKTGAMTRLLAATLSATSIAAGVATTRAQERPTGDGFSFRTGVELINVTATVTDQFKVRFDYTTTRTRDETTDLGLLRRPGNKTSVAAVLTPLNELTIAATLVHVSSWVDVNRDTAVFVPRLDAPAYTTFNLAANYIVNKNVTVFARADNLFNEHYQNPVGFLRPGLGVYAGLRANN